MSASHVANPWRSRVISRYAWIEAAAAIIACAVSFILPFGPILLLAGWLGGQTLAGLAALAWIASGLLVVLPTVSESVVSWLTGAKEPARAEADRLAAAWDDVCRATAIEPHSFALRVIPCPQPTPEKPPYINAFAAGTNVVAVSSDALALLDDRKLRALLAHELGHHAGYDAVPRGLIAWYLGLTEPILWPFPRSTVGAILRLLYLPVTLVLGLASRPCEFAADAFAARLGHGPSLQRLLADLGPNDPPTLTTAILASHPATIDRIRRLTAESA
jgi:Zn-dependent protease with chaperone function